MEAIVASQSLTPANLTEVLWALMKAAESSASPMTGAEKKQLVLSFIQTMIQRLPIEDPGKAQLQAMYQLLSPQIDLLIGIWNGVVDLGENMAKGKSREPSGCFSCCGFGGNAKKTTKTETTLLAPK